jgi:anti-anti-sigma factor
MAFESNIEIANGVARVMLAGDLDAASAPQLKAQIEQAAQAQVGRLVLLMHQLSYMASAGLRVLVFAKQKMGAGVDIYMVGAQEMVRETITMTGFDKSVFLVETEEAIRA